jgi:alkylhydroperoxidase family enzyme
LANFEARSDLGANEKAALRFAERMTLDSNNVDEALWSQLREHFDDGEVVELASAIGLFNYFNKFNNALKMEPTK